MLMFAQHGALDVSTSLALGAKEDFFCFSYRRWRKEARNHMKEFLKFFAVFVDEKSINKRKCVWSHLFFIIICGKIEIFLYYFRVFFFGKCNGLRDDIKVCEQWMENTTNDWTIEDGCGWNNIRWKIRK